MIAGEVGVRLTFETGITLTGGTVVLRVLKPRATATTTLALTIDTVATRAYLDTVAADWNTPGEYKLQVTVDLTTPTRHYTSAPITFTLGQEI